MNTVFVLKNDYTTATSFRIENFFHDFTQETTSSLYYPWYLSTKLEPNIYKAVLGGKTYAPPLKEFPFLYNRYFLTKEQPQLQKYK